MNFFSTDLVPTYCDIAKNGSVVVFDTETTGLTPADDVVEIAVVVMHHGNMVYSESVYLKNRVPIDGTVAQQVNHITDAKLAEKGKDPKEVLTCFLDRLDYWLKEDNGKVLLVAHNLSFDWGMISAMLAKYDLPPIPDKVIPCCTKEFVKALKLPKSILPGNHLRNCIKAFNLQGVNSHVALADTMACLELFKYLTAE